MEVSCIVRYQVECITDSDRHILKRDELSTGYRM